MRNIYTFLPTQTTLTLSLTAPHQAQFRYIAVENGASVYGSFSHRGMLKREMCQSDVAYDQPYRHSGSYPVIVFVWCAFTSYIPIK